MNSLREKNCNIYLSLLRFVVDTFFFFFFSRFSQGNILKWNGSYLPSFTVRSLPLLFENWLRVNESFTKNQLQMSMTVSG